MNLLVTGGCGFIGSHFVRWQRRNHPHDRLVVLDSLSYCGNLANLLPIEHDTGWRFVRGDITDSDAVSRVFLEERIDAMCNFAAETHVDRSILSSLPFVKTNVVGTTVLLDVAKQANVHRFVQVSTDEVYGTLAPTDPPFSEHTPLAPRSPYSASKAAADHLALAYFHTHGLPVVITRCSNNYGPYQFPEKLIPLLILRAMADQPLPIYGDGQQVRDWLYVEDHCAGIDAALRRGQPGEAYNFGGRCEKRNLEIVELVLELLEKPRSLIRFVQDRPGHDRRYAIDCDKAENELGFRPRMSLVDGLVETVRFYKNHTDWCKNIETGAYRAYCERNYGSRLGTSQEVA